MCHAQKQPRSAFASIPALLLITALALSGCAQVKPDPFVKLADGSSKASAAIDKEAAVYVQGYQELFNREQSANATFNPGLIQLASEKFTTRYPLLDQNEIDHVAKELLAGKKLAELVHPKKSGVSAMYYGFILADMQAKIIKELNTAFNGYTESLVLLAKSDITDAQISAVGKEFTKPLTAISGYIPAIKTLGPDKIANLLAQAFAEAVKAKKRAYIAAGMQDVQNLVDQYSDACVQLIKLIQSITIELYEKKFAEFSQEFSAEKSQDKREKLLYQMQSLNASFALKIETLGKLNEYYGMLPSAHKEIAKNIKANIVDFPALERMAAYGKQLYDLYILSTKTTQAAAQ